MHRGVKTVSRSTNASDAASLMARHRIGVWSVVDKNNKLVGILSATDILGVSSKIDRENSAKDKKSKAAPKDKTKAATAIKKSPINSIPHWGFSSCYALLFPEPQVLLLNMHIHLRVRDTDAFLIKCFINILIHFKKHAPEVAGFNPCSDSKIH